MFSPLRRVPLTLAMSEGSRSFVIAVRLLAFDICRVFGRGETAEKTNEGSMVGRDVAMPSSSRSEKVYKNHSTHQHRGHRVPFLNCQASHPIPSCTLNLYTIRRTVRPSRSDAPHTRVPRLPRSFPFFSRLRTRFKYWPTEILPTRVTGEICYADVV